MTDHRAAGKAIFALGPWLRHYEDCAFKGQFNADCTCGLQTTLDELQRINTAISPRPGEQIGGAGDDDDEWDPWASLDKAGGGEADSTLRGTAESELSADTLGATVPPNAAPVPVPPTDAERERLAVWCDNSALTKMSESWGKANFAGYFRRIAALLRGEQSPNTIPPQAEWGVRDRLGTVVGVWHDREKAERLVADMIGTGAAIGYPPYRLCRIIDEE